MPYVVALAEAAVFTLAGAIITLMSAIFFRHFLAFAWRMWLWGSIGLVTGNLVLVAVLSSFLIGIGIAGAQRTSARDLALAYLILFGPLVITTLGILLGCLYGWRRTRQLGV